VEKRGGGGGNIAMAASPKMRRTDTRLLMVNPSLRGQSDVVGTCLTGSKGLRPGLAPRFSHAGDCGAPSVPARTLKELVELIKANPKSTLCIAGTGTPAHLVGQVFRQSLRPNLVHVPYNSAGEAVGSTGRRAIHRSAASAVAGGAAGGRRQAPRPRGDQRCALAIAEDVPTTARPVIRASSETTGRGSSCGRTPKGDHARTCIARIARPCKQPDIRSASAWLASSRWPARRSSLPSARQSRIRERAEGDKGLRHQAE